jgi:hypothetical protein
MAIGERIWEGGLGGRELLEAMPLESGEVLVRVDLDGEPYYYALEHVRGESRVVRQGAHLETVAASAMDERDSPADMDARMRRAGWPDYIRELAIWIRE